jgi:hypothetical protein
MGYYNSDLSEFIGKQCKKTMTSIDVDILQIKSSRNILRFIESKHTNEKIGDQQGKALRTLAWIAKIVNKNPVLFNGKKIEVYLVRGDKPYEKIDVYNFLTFKSYRLEDIEKIKSFLEVEYDLTDQDLI